MGQYLIDSNVISHFLAGKFSSKGMDLMNGVLDQSLNISVITEIESLSWINTDKSKEKIVQEFVNDANVLGLTNEIVRICVKLRRNRKIKTPDAIIAATAIFHDLTLLSNDKGFQFITDLKYLDPHAL